MTYFTDNALVFIEEDNLAGLEHLINFYVKAIDIEDSNYTTEEFAIDINDIFSKALYKWNNDIERYSTLGDWLKKTIENSIFSKLLAEQLKEEFKLYDVIDNKKVIELTDSGYIADSEIINHKNKKSKKKYRNRLFLGEADFSYTKAIIIKHAENFPELPLAVTTTEFQSEQLLKNTYISFENNINSVKEKGINPLFAVDATTIEKTFPNERFRRIHFNCPYNNNPSTTTALVTNFFKSAKQLQQDGDRIHMALVDKNKYFWHGFTYGIVKASLKANYKVVGKRNFGAQRYPGYEHKETKTDKSSPNAQYAKEFIFEKTKSTIKEIVNEYTEKKILLSSIENKGKQFFFNVKTDSDSSDYLTENSSDENIIANKC